MALVIPPSFGSFGDIDDLGIFMPDSFDIICNLLHDSFQIVHIQKEGCVDICDRMSKLVNKERFFFTILD